MKSLNIVFHLENGEKKVYPVAERKFTIGRSNKNNIVLPFDTFSREHCLIEIEDDVVYISDLNSSNGVYLEGKRLDPNVRTRYDLTTPLMIGATKTNLIFTEKSIQSSNDLSVKKHNSTDLKDLNRGPVQNPNVPNRTRKSRGGSGKNKQFTRKEILLLVGILAMISVVVSFAKGKF